MNLFKLLELVKTETRHLLLSSAVVNIILLAPALYMLQIYDSVMLTYDLNTLAALSLILLYFFIIFFALEYLRNLFQHDMAIKIESHYLNLIKLKILAIKNYQDQISITQTQSAIARLKVFISGPLFTSIIDMPWFFIFVLSIFLFHIHLGLIAIFSAALMVGLSFYTHYKLKPQREAELRSNNYENSFLNLDENNYNSSLANGTLINLYKKEIKKFQEKISSEKRTASFSSLSQSLSKTLRLGSQSFILGYGAYLAVLGEISPGAIIAGSILLGRALAPIDSFVVFIKNHHLINENIKTVINFSNNITDVKKIKFPSPCKSLLIKNVDVNTQENITKLKNLNFEFKFGNIYSVIGPNGSGKSTFLKLMAGLESNYTGSVEIDGNDLAQWDKAELGKYLGFMGQRPTFSRGSLKEIITRYSYAADDEVITHLSKFGADELLKQLPKNINTDEDGFFDNFSEGEKKIFSLAKAFWGDPKIILLDEPEAGLDNFHINKISDYLIKYLSPENLIVFSTHKPSLAQISSEVIILNNNTIVDHQQTSKFLNNLND